MLRREDFAEGVWKRLEADLQSRLDELREMNDRLKNTNEETLLIRGRIDEVKRLLALRKSSAGESAEPIVSWPQQPGA